jgi:hypothetical protein
MNSDNKQIRDVADVAARIMAGLPVAEELKGGQVKLDKNHNGKIDGQDFKILKGEKKIKENLEDFSLEEIEEFMVSEEFEQLDELSKDTLKSYRVKSIGRAGSFENKGYEAGKKGGGAGSDKADKLFNKSDLVAAARKRAQEKMRKEEFVQEREDDEYHTPSRHHVQVQVSKGDGQKTYRKATVRAKEPEHAVSAAIAHYKQQGYTVHDHKYLGEDVEQIDELSKGTLNSYVKKSFSDKEKPNLNTPERQKGLRKATSRLYKEDEKLDEEDAYEKDRYAVKNGKAVKDNPTHQGSPNYKDQPHHVYATSAENALKNHTKKEEVEQIDIEEGAKETAQKALNLADKLRKKDPEKSKMYRNLGIKASQRSNNPTGVKSGQPHGSGNKALRKQGIEPVPSSISSSKMRGYFEEVEQMDEVKMADLPSTKVQGRAYGASKPEPHALDLTKGPKDKELKNIDAEKKKKFSEMVNLYQDGGMKSFMESLSKEEEENIIDEVSKEIADYTMDVIDAGEYTEVTIGEEASQEEFNAEIEKAKAKSQGKVKAEVAKAAVQAVKQEEVELGEDRMNDAEMEKREKIVKGMKKGLSGFKERYGDRAKNVMYATATKRAMEK